MCTFYRLACCLHRGNRHIHSRLSIMSVWTHCVGGMCKQFPVFVCLTMATGQPKLFLVYFYNVHLKQKLVELFLFVRILYISVTHADLRWLVNILSCRVPALEYLSGLLVWPNVPCDPNWAFRYFDNFGYFENLEYCGFSWKFLCFGENTHDEKFGSDLFGRVIVPYDALKELVSEVSPKLPQFSQEIL